MGPHLVLILTSFPNLLTPLCLWSNILIFIAMTNTKTSWNSNGFDGFANESSKLTEGFTNMRMTQSYLVETFMIQYLGMDIVRKWIHGHWISCREFRLSSCYTYPTSQAGEIDLEVRSDSSHLFSWQLKVFSHKILIHCYHTTTTTFRHTRVSLFGVLFLVILDELMMCIIAVSLIKYLLFDKVKKSTWMGW